MSPETARFISENQNEDILLLALKSDRFPGVDLPLAIRQINGKQKIKYKVPTFFNNNEILYPQQLSLEQSSSESTANYKKGLCEGNVLADLTGGFGVDCCFMSEKFDHVYYVERNIELCEIATHNFNALKKENIQVFHQEVTDFLMNLNEVDWIYIDPARRNENGKKMVLISDCEPDILKLMPILFQKSKNVMIKLSPMIDLSSAIKSVQHLAEIHIISIENECKEVLIILKSNFVNDLIIKTINISNNKKEQLFEFYFDQESSTVISYSTKIEKYLYEPNASIMKSGAFKYIGSQFNINKLQTNSHLYTSSNLENEFPGRIFEVIKVWGNSKSDLKKLSETTRKANISIRNYPNSVEDLRKKLKIKDGGDIYLYASTLSNQKKLIIECRKV